MLDSGSLTFMKLTGYKVDSADALVELNLSGGDTIDDATAVRIDLTLRFDAEYWEGAEEIPVHSLVF